MMNEYRVTLIVRSDNPGNALLSVTFQDSDGEFNPSIVKIEGVEKV